MSRDSQFIQDEIAKNARKASEAVAPKGPSKDVLGAMKHLDPLASAVKHHQEDRANYPHASATEHHTAAFAQTVTEKAIEKTAGFAGKTAGGFMAGPLGATIVGAAATQAVKPVAKAAGHVVNGAVHGLFEDARQQKVDEQAQAAQWQESWQQRDRSERLQSQTTAADSVSEMRSSAGQSAQLHMQINVPLPSVAPKINASDTTEIVCTKIDRYFDDIIRGYPESTRQLLHDMYEDKENKYIDSSKTSIEEGQQANWQLDHSENGNHFQMVIDTRLRNCPVTFRLNKIHEIAIHIGQAHQRLEQVGADTFFRELGTFRKFTEQSVVLAEKILHDALPREIIARDLENIRHTSIFEVMEKDCLARKVINFDDYLHMQHRDHCDKLTPSDHETFLRNPHIASFLESNVQQFYPGVSGTAISTYVYRTALEKTVRSFQEMPKPVYTAQTKPKTTSAAATAEKTRATTAVSAYEKALERTSIANRTIPVPHYAASASAAASQLAVQSHHVVSTNAVTTHLNRKPADELRLSVRQANIALRERSQFHQEQVAQFQTQRAVEIISTGGEIFGLASRVCRYAGNDEMAQFFSLTSQLVSGFVGFIMTGGVFGLIMPFISFFLSNRAEEEARRFARMIEAAAQSLNGVHQDVSDELHEFVISVQKEIRYTGMLVAEVLAEQNTCRRLNDAVFNELDILQRLMGRHFENTNAYLHVLMTRSLKTKCENLQSVLNGTNGVQPSQKQIREDLHDLEFWIMSRLHHPMMNGASYLNATLTEVTAILSQQSYPLITMPSFFAGCLHLALGVDVPPAFLSLPPMSLYFQTIQLFCKVLEKHPELLSKNFKAVFAHIQETLTTYGELIAFIKTNEMQIRQSQLSAEEKEIILKPLAQIAVYETAVQEMKNVIADYQKRLHYLTDPLQQLEVFTRVFFNVPESQGAFWKKESQTDQSVFCVMHCREFSGSRELQREFIRKLESRNVKAGVTIINNERFLQVQLVTTAIPVIMPSIPAAYSSSFFQQANPALLHAGTNTTQQPQLRGA